MARDSKGRFTKGPDPHRHKFTQAECQAGFWAAITAIVIRHPDAVNSAGMHMACYFLKNKKGAK